MQRFFLFLLIASLFGACTKQPPVKNSPEPANTAQPATIATPPVAERKSPAGGSTIKPDFTSAKSAVDTFVAAAQAQDQAVLSQCFDPESPGEYQTLIDKTASESQLTRLAVQFEAAKVGVIQTDGDLATVNVGGKNSSGEIHLKKTVAGWKILEF